MNRRGFLAGILAAGVAPAAIGSGVLMPIKVIATPPGLSVIGCDFGRDEMFTGYVGHWNGIRVIQTFEPMLEREEVHRFMQQHGLFRQFHRPAMHNGTVFMHPSDDFFKALKGKDHG